MLLDDLFPVMVVYRCRLDESETYATLLTRTQFRAFMLYDNSPEGFTIDPTSLPPCAVYVRDPDNGGVSKAYNAAADYAERHGFTHLLLLDQDTRFPADAIDAYLAAPDGHAMIAPRLSTRDGRPFSPVTSGAWSLRGVALPPGEYELHAYSPVNCGMCIALTAFRRAGGYNPRVRLDYADFDFTRRLAAGNPRFALIDLDLSQDFSNDTPHLHALVGRFRLYTDSALHVTTRGWGERLRLAFQIGKHTLALTARTRSPRFLLILIAQLLKRKL